MEAIKPRPAVCTSCRVGNHHLCFGTVAFARCHCGTCQGGAK